MDESFQGDADGASKWNLWVGAGAKDSFVEGDSSRTVRCLRPEVLTSPDTHQEMTAARARSFQAFAYYRALYPTVSVLKLLESHPPIYLEGLDPKSDGHDLCSFHRPVL